MSSQAVAASSGKEVSSSRPYSRAWSSRSQTRAVVSASAARGPRRALPRACAGRLSVIRWCASDTASQLTGSAKSMLRSMPYLTWVPRVTSSAPLGAVPSLAPPTGPVAPGLVTPAPVVATSGAVPTVPSELSVIPVSVAWAVLRRCMDSMRGALSTASRRAPRRCILA